MTVTFDDAVPEEARAGLAKFIVRAHEVGIACKSLVTRKPGTDMYNRALLAKDRIVYGFALDEEGDIHVTVDEEG